MNEGDPRREPAVPEELARDLSALCGKAVPVPHRVDAAITARARRRFARTARLRRLVRRGAAAAAAAAAVLVLALLVVPAFRPGPPRIALRSASRRIGREAPAAGDAPAGPRQDIDGNGTVDIVDALVLARRLEAPSPASPAWDLNGDGAVDQADVDLVAMAAVRLEGG